MLFRSILHAAGPQARLPALGQTLWLIPGHCDPTVNLHDRLLGVRGGLEHGVVERVIGVDARGALTCCAAGMPRSTRNLDPVDPRKG